MEDENKENPIGGEEGTSPETGSTPEVQEVQKAVEALKKEKESLLADITSLRSERREIRSAPSATPVVPAKEDDKSDLSKAVESRAVRKFLEAHPEYQDDAKWKSIESNFVNRRGNHLWEDVFDDLEDAYFLANRTAILSDAAREGANSAAARMLGADKADIGGTGSSGDASKQISQDEVKLSDDERRIFENMRQVDPSLTIERFTSRKKTLSQ